MKAQNNMDNWLKDNLSEHEASFTLEEMQADWEQVNSAISSSVPNAGTQAPTGWASFSAKVGSALLVAAAASTITYLVLKEQPSDLAPIETIENYQTQIPSQNSNTPIIIDTSANSKSQANSRKEDVVHEKLPQTGLKIAKSKQRHDDSKISANETKPVKSNKNGVGLLISDTKICVGEVLELTNLGKERLLVEVFFNGKNVEKTVLESEYQLSFEESGEVLLEVFGIDGKNLVASYHVQIIDRPKADFTYTLLNHQLQLNSKPVNTSSIEWLVNDQQVSQMLNPEIIRINESGQNMLKITLIAYNQSCSDTMNKEHLLTTNEEKTTENLIVGNAFSPNGDGANDKFKIESKVELAQFELIILDKAGREVFTTKNLNDFWNGNEFNGEKLCPSGSYIYLINYVERETLKAKQMKGFLFLAR